MPRTKPTPSKEELLKLYNDDLLSISEIAKQYAVSQPLVTKWFRTLDIAVRSPKEETLIQRSRNPEKYKQEWRNNEEKMRVIKEKLSTSHKALYKDPNKKVNCKIYDIPSKEDLEYLYVERGFSANTVSKMMSVSIPTLKKWIEDYGIKFRDISESLHELNERDLIYNLYKDKNAQKWIQGRRKSFNRSKAEIEIYEWIAQFYPNIQHSVNIGSKNYDILIPDLKLLIEYNGLFWHSEAVYYRTSNQNRYNLSYFRHIHEQKRKNAIENGYRCFQIFEDDWRDRKEAVQNFLLSIFNINKTKVMARKCKVVDVPKQTTNEFLNRHHLQGTTHRYSSSIGLIFNNELIAVAVFAKEGEDMNLVRYAVDGRYAITGGFAKLISHFQKSCNKRIITFADMTYVNEKENVYLRNGFKPVSKLAEDYKYIIDEKRYHKFGFRRANLSKMLGASFDPSLSEYENCVKNEIYRIWDAGKIKYIKDQKPCCIGSP